MITKGIILAGGSGTRLFPVTAVVSKQLLPVYDKPMIYYPLSVFMLAKIKTILLITTEEDLPRFKKLLGGGEKWGIKISYAIQENPGGLAEAFIIGKDFIGKDSVALILGDNIFYGSDLSNLLSHSIGQNKGATVFAYKVTSPERYGVVEFDRQNKAISIEEKPVTPKSRFAVTGLYFYDNEVVSIAEMLKPSKRNELEITDINKYYLQKKSLDVKILETGMAWLDTGTFESLSEASSFIQVIQKRQGIKIACLEEIAYLKKYISAEDVKKIASTMSNSEYGQYLLEMLEK